MANAFQRLERVLKLEKQQGYQNKAVVGGIRQFATFWVTQAREESADEGDRFFVDQTAETLASYNRLPGTEARANVINNLLTQLERRTQRIQKAGKKRAAKAAQPKPPPRLQKPPAQAAPKPAAKPAQKPAATPKANTASKAAEKSPNHPKVQSSERGKKQDARPAPDPVGLEQSVTSVRGVGPKLAVLLEKLGATTVRDLLYLAPRRYDDYTKMKPIRQLQYGEVVSVIGTVWQVRARKVRNNQTVVHAVLGDGTDKIQLNFYGQPWLVNQMKSGMQIVVSGKVDQYLGRHVFNSPEWEPLAREQLKTNRIVPVYPLTKGLGANKMRSIMKSVVDYWAVRMPDPLPERARGRNQLFRLSDAIRHIHFPRSDEMLRKAQERLAFDELLLLQLGMLHQRSLWQRQPARALMAAEAERARLFDSLPFEPTGAQRRVTQEIVDDMQRQVPMNRLVQGDVGAGKTLVAAAALVHAVRSGVQTALMAPTSILAEQHAKKLKDLLGPLDITVELLIGSTSAKEKKRIYAETAAGAIDVLVGTTALIQPDVVFSDLGFVVIDEQHRFGVDQRGALRDKGKEEHHPHLLVMTATPIPRTLALSMYGDLDLSIIDEMPPGRQEISTHWLKETERERAYGFARRQMQAGRQVYMIFPLVEESDKLDVKAAVDEHTRLQKEVFPNFKLGLLHGRMTGAEKEESMRAFYAHETQLLVSTTVVEVGVDVPNSTVIVIEGANRFGLAQLHQLRGRVGRGQHKSYCLLISDSTTQDAIERLKALEDTNDGFQLAEKDLELRGPGEFFGRRQSGIPELQLASIFDSDMLERTRNEAQAIFKDDPDLETPEYVALRDLVKAFWDNTGDVS